jgi:hypothetical protein
MIDHHAYRGIRKGVAERSSPAPFGQHLEQRSQKRTFPGPGHTMDKRYDRAMRWHRKRSFTKLHNVVEHSLLS